MIFILNTIIIYWLINNFYYIINLYCYSFKYIYFILIFNKFNWLGNENQWFYSVEGFQNQDFCLSNEIIMVNITNLDQPCVSGPLTLRKVGLIFSNLYSPPYLWPSFGINWHQGARINERRWFKRNLITLPQPDQF